MGGVNSSVSVQKLQPFHRFGIFPFKALEDVSHVVNAFHLRHHLSDFYLTVLDITLEDGTFCRLLPENLPQGIGTLTAGLGLGDALEKGIPRQTCGGNRL